jgi:hypothetical protein
MCLGPSSSIALGGEGPSRGGGHTLWGGGVISDRYTFRAMGLIAYFGGGGGGRG